MTYSTFLKIASFKVSCGLISFKEKNYKEIESRREIEIFVSVQQFSSTRIQIKSSLYARYYCITPERVTSGGAHLRGIPPEQHSVMKRRSDGEP